MKKALWIVFIVVILALLYFLYPKPLHSEASIIATEEFSGQEDITYLSAPKVAIEAEISPKIALHKMNYTEAMVMDRVKMCESGGNPNAKNKNSTASGSYQILQSTWNYEGKKLWGSLEGKDIFNPKDNEELAVYLFEKYGTSPWLESKACWSK